MSVTIAMPRMSTDPELTTAQSKYVESLARAGAEVHWVELSDPDAAAAEALTCDGLLLPGGGDMDPAFYGQERIPACGEPNLLRDAAEPKLLRAFLAADKPVLGICRGIQVMNVVLGGTLYQDIKPFEHVPHNDHWAKVHTVTVRRGTLLSRLLGQDTVLVNSQHHQAADRIAPELEIAALSEDGIVEALEKPDAHFCLGVQWHPEHPSVSLTQLTRLLDEGLGRSALLLVQSRIPAEFDWRIGFLDGSPLFACRRYRPEPGNRIRRRKHPLDMSRIEALPLTEVPERVLQTARRAVHQLGNGLFGVDLRQQGQGCVLLEIIDNPWIRGDIEDREAKDLYERLARAFRQRLENRGQSATG